MKKTPTINERIDEVMLDRGLSPQELATKINRHVTTVTRILSGETTPGNATIKAIADAMDCPAEYLIKGTGPSKSEKPSDNPYKDFLVQELKGEVESWKTEYQWLKELVNDMRNGKALGKLNPVKGTARRAVA